jgi:predicted nucleic acid-binding protein
MIVYLDTSSLVKLYVEEIDSEKIKNLGQSNRVKSCLLIFQKHQD